MMNINKMMFVRNIRTSSRVHSDIFAQTKVLDKKPRRKIIQERPNDVVKSESTNAASASNPLSRHEQNQKDINKTIKSLKTRIEKDPEKLERDLSKLVSPSPAKPQLSDFKWPMANAFLMASIVYFLFSYTWEYLDFEAREQQLLGQIATLEAEVAEVEKAREAAKNGESVLSTSKPWYKKLLWS